MESCDVLVEIYSKEIKISNTGFLSGGIAFQVLIKVVCSFGGDRSNLFIASSVPWNEQNRNSM